VLNLAHHDRMPSKIYGSKCPPGVFCLTPGFVVISIAVIAACVYAVYQGPKMLLQIQQPQPQPVTVQVDAQDDRYSRAPKPERHWVTETDLPTSAEMYGKLPRVPTRGLPETYQAMGVIKTDDGQILPLYGRRTVSRSDRFQYYTRTDSYNPVQLPIQHNRRDCTDDIGCEELYDRESVTVKPTGQRGTVTIYRYDGPTYIPGLI
jgi:Family of unknown function (DUF5755)